MPWPDGPSIREVALLDLPLALGLFDRSVDLQISVAPPKVIAVSLIAAPLPEQPNLPREPIAVLVDVMLVLLIVLTILAPLFTHAVMSAARAEA